MNENVPVGGMAHGVLNDRLVEVAGWPTWPWKSWRLQTARQTIAVQKSHQASIDVSDAAIGGAEAGISDSD